MADFGRSFLDMAEAMLGKSSSYTRSSSCNILKSSSSELNANDRCNSDGGEAGKKRALSSMLKEKPSITNNDTSTISTCSGNSKSNPPQDNARPFIDSPSPDNNNNKKSERRRSVDFKMLPPKRQRMTAGNYSATDIVQELNCAMSPKERKEALENAMGTFDHNERDIHDNEIEAGADIALVKTLVFLEFKANFRREPIKANREEITLEIGTVLKTLECVYRASSDAVGKSFNRVGTDLLQILVVLIDDEINDSARKNEKKNGGSLEDTYSYVHDLVLRKATKIIGHFARVGMATRPMARFPGFLGSVLNLINMRPYSSIPFEARLSCLWTIANLACNTDNMAMMMSTPNLIDSLVTITNRRPNSGDSIETIMEILRAKSIASRSFLNLSWSPENKILMSENVAVVLALSRLVMERQAPYKSSKTMQTVLVQARRHSIASLRNISAAPRRSKISLCSYNSGKLLDVLTDVALNETDQYVVDLSFSAIHNLAIEETAEAIVDRPALVLALKNVLLEDDNNNDDSQEGERHSVTCQCASATILVLESAITPDKPSYENLRELLDAINPSNTTELNVPITTSQ